MLGKRDIEYIDKYFYIYDQNWRMYQNYLGEPFLINDCLAYYDSRIIYICAFPFKNNKCIELYSIVTEFKKIMPNCKIDIIDIWGNCNVQSFLLSNKEAMILDYTPRDALRFDSIIDIDSFELQNNKKARLAYNACINKNIQSRIVKLESLSFQHIKLMEMFVSTHVLSGPHSTIFMTIDKLIHDKNAYVVESFQGNKILGFAILMKVSNSHASYCLACYDNTTRAADSTLFACIDFCKCNNLSVLHLGYSVNESLLNFKKKWGGSANGIEYEEFFISVTNDKALLSNISDGKFLWKDRLYSK